MEAKYIYRLKYLLMLKQDLIQDVRLQLYDGKNEHFQLTIFLLHNNLGSLLFFLFFVCFCCLEDFSQMVFKMNAEIYARI